MFGAGHGSDIVSRRVDLARAFDWDRFKVFLAEILWEQSEVDVLRLKGLVSFSGKPHKYALQAVREQWELTETAVACDGQSSFVWIGRRIPFDDWTAKMNLL